MPIIFITYPYIRRCLLYHLKQNKQDEHAKDEKADIVYRITTNKKKSPKPSPRTPRKDTVYINGYIHIYTYVLARSYLHI